jgi:hypothetical protein
MQVAVKGERQAGSTPSIHVVTIIEDATVRPDGTDRFWLVRTDRPIALRLVSYRKNAKTDAFLQLSSSPKDFIHGLFIIHYYSQIEVGTTACMRNNATMQFLYQLLSHGQQPIINNQSPITPLILQSFKKECLCNTYKHI